MNNLEFIKNLEYMEIEPYILKIFFISICTYYVFLKILNIKSFINIKLIIIALATFIITVICSFLKYKSTSFVSTLCLIFLLSSLYSIITKNKFGFSILITITSLSINYILFFIAVLIDFIPNVIYSVQTDYMNLLIIFVIHTILVYSLFKIRKFKHGFTFLQKSLQNEYFDIFILNISITILFSAIILNNLNVLFLSSMSITFLILSIIDFITIQKIFTMYYKHKLLITELKKTKIELEKKKKEIVELETENLNFSKISHSIAHKQKSLEYKLHELMLKTEVSSEIDINDKLNEISNEYFYNITTNVELSKTNIAELDDMLAFMQDECIKNNIDFELQITGNIHHMTNNFISKEDLEILIADHIKNAIIAINHSDNVNRSILVRLGMIDRFYSLYIYDSGIEFEIDTLLNLGKNPCTTYSNNGGTGMGFLNTFDTLAKYQASILINEMNSPCKENYTKSVIIRFDKQYKYRISSYRAEEIKEKNTRRNLIID